MKYIIITFMLLLTTITFGQSFTGSCNDTTELSRLQHDGDVQDARGNDKAISLNKLILFKHQGHPIKLSQMQHLVMTYPGQLTEVCYMCRVHGHFDLYKYLPLERYEVHCADRVWLIPID
jgi:hypothetical protein